MTLLLTLLFDLLMIILFLFRLVQGDQIIFIVSIVLQGLLFIDLLAVVLLRPQKPKNLAIEEETPRRRSHSHQAPKSARGGLLAKFSCIVALLVLAYYIYTVLYIFI
ncbi:hypothetical protein [Enterococcus xiangfangensis]|uniref:DUF3899 domain-containing protein n=1 Tax=Enterococcus xiangfangensis TaxID=1296537 RepID=A0ABU3FCF2_9ENTE|nr:hypothetical protein [Enterococcus xiangfangensis]MBM7711586.1 hypothetical protein [Enterococcus xiangfangensis]MDT2760350.1 hypothetical protein [Enterococcus xiangfangensis]NBK09358.1 hypothetical protein [Enterococcus asini]